MIIMPKCEGCGNSVIIYEDTNFCPYCGALLKVVNKIEETTLKCKPKKKFATLSSRALFLLFILAFCFTITLFGTTAQLEASEATEINENLQEIRETIEVFGIPIIYGNNLMHCMIMFLPFIGSVWGINVLYSTGRVIASAGIMSGANPQLLYILLFLYPFTWLEYISYSIAISESFWLLYSIIKSKFKYIKNEAKNAYKAIAICSILLLIAAFSEIIILMSLGI
jgi:hypothetical protein